MVAKASAPPFGTGCGAVAVRLNVVQDKLFVVFKHKDILKLSPMAFPLAGLGHHTHSIVPLAVSESSHLTRSIDWWAESSFFGHASP